MRNRTTLILLALTAFTGMAAPATGQVSSSQVQNQNVDQEKDDLSGKHVVGIEFRGNRIFSDEQLLEQFSYTKERNQATFPAFDFTYSSDLMDHDLRNANFFMRSRGYLRAKINEPEAEASANGIKLIMQVEEGELYRIGKIEVHGATVFSTDEIIQFLNVEPGDIANGKEIGDGLYERLKQAYGEKGYIQYTAEPTPTFNVPDGSNEGVVDFTIEIDEGTRFRTRSIEFAGYTRATDGLLRNTMLIREGEVYNQKLFKESIDRLNALGLIEELDADRDVDFRTDEEEYRLDIIIKTNHAGNEATAEVSPVLKRRAPEKPAQKPMLKPMLKRRVIND